MQRLPNHNVHHIPEPLDVYRFVDVEAKECGGLVEDRTAGKMSASLVRVLETAPRAGR